METVLPSALNGRAADRVDSGRNCSEAGLGTLAREGIREVRFAGALWETGERSGTTIAIFEAPGLSVEDLAEFYEAGARDARKTDAITTAEYHAGTTRGRRLDTLNDESFQTVVVLPGPEHDFLWAVLVASDIRETGTMDAHEDAVARAVAAALGP